MIYYKHNDFRIIDQIQEGNSDALELMFEKYNPLISKKISYFNLGYMYEDMVQESYMLLYKSLLTYDLSYQRTFTRYFELNLERMMISYIKKSVRRSEIFFENTEYIKENNHSNASSVYYELYRSEIESILLKEEYDIFMLREIKNFSIGYISETLNIPSKKVYNTLYRAKQKIKAHFEL